MRKYLSSLNKAFVLSVCFVPALPAYGNVLVLDSNGNYVEASSVKTNETPFAAPTATENLEQEGIPFLDPNAAVATESDRLQNPSIFYDIILEDADALASATSTDLRITPANPTSDPETIPISPQVIVGNEQAGFESEPVGDLVFAKVIQPEILTSNSPDYIPRNTALPPVVLEAMPSLTLSNEEDISAPIAKSAQTEFDMIIQEEVAKYDNVDAAFVTAVISAESNYDITAVSPKGAMGLMQIMPDTAKRYDVVNPFSPVQNIRAGTAELSRLMTLYRNPSLALAAYNAGEGAVEKHDGVPPFSETQQYIVRVLTKTFEIRERLLAESEKNTMVTSEKIAAEEEEDNPLQRPLVVQTFNY